MDSVFQALFSLSATNANLTGWLIRAIFSSSWTISVRLRGALSFILTPHCFLVGARLPDFSSLIEQALL